MTLEARRKVIRYVSYVIIVTICLLAFWAARSPIFLAGGPFQLFIERLGYWGPFVCILIIIFITAIPVIPFGIMNVITVLVYGPLIGLLVSIIGMLLGSFLNFYLGRRFGEPFIRSFISDEQYDKYIHLLSDGRRYEKILIVGFILPVFPDDVFCMISGMTKMSFKRFFIITVLCRPLSLVVFTMLSTNIVQVVFYWLQEFWKVV